VFCQWHQRCLLMDNFPTQRLTFSRSGGCFSRHCTPRKQMRGLTTPTAADGMATACLCWPPMWATVPRDYSSFCCTAILPNVQTRPDACPIRSSGRTFARCILFKTLKAKGKHCALRVPIMQGLPMKSRKHLGINFRNSALPERRWTGKGKTSAKDIKIEWES